MSALRAGTQHGLLRLPLSPVQPLKTALAAWHPLSPPLVLRLKSTGPGAGAPVRPISRPKSVPLKRWNRVGRHRQLRLWHIARIEVEGYGEPAAEPCEHCAEKGKLCWVYKEEHRQALGNTCSTCRNGHILCSHAEGRSLLSGYPSSRILLNEEVARLREENVQLRTQVKVLMREKNGRDAKGT